MADLGVSVQTRVAIGKWWRGNRSDDEKRQDLWIRANGVIKSEMSQDNYMVQYVFGVHGVIISEIWYGC